MPDVPPGFTDTLNSENLEFGRPPTSVQHFASGTSRKPLSTNIPTAPVELPSPLSSFSVGKPVNFGEVDPRYIHNRAPQFGNLSSSQQDSLATTGKGLEFYNNHYPSSITNDVSFVNTSHDTSVVLPGTSLPESSAPFSPSSRSESISTQSSLIVSQSPGAASRFSAPYSASKGAPLHSTSSKVGNVGTSDSGGNLSANTPSSDNRAVAYNQRHVASQPISSNVQEQLYQLQNALPNASGTSSQLNLNKDKMQSESGTDHYSTPSKQTTASADKNSYFSSSTSPSSAYNKLSSATESQKEQQQMRYPGQHSNPAFSRGSSGPTSYQQSCEYSECMSFYEKDVGSQWDVL